ncbi:hypothetical protein LO772_24230 [Yinghuangia sp. ASG 101]|uniref:hypothetical protein n=1 Tax=Yinghuangia sp. ASG 101 TaxID=2896848 RepID=UPI001E571B30|nr:hypothetical protein [Yinghuangia sp. ASG 101]UGQ09984.1 hypothetical protein LO772_24230 [Yinghuangia sp. ASG 101]
MAERRSRRWFRRGREEPEPPLVDDGTLVVVGESFDPARADSAVLADLAEAGVVVEGRQLMLRHVLRLPDDAAVAEAARLLGPDGWAVSAGPDGATYADRSQRVNALELARERTRMAGLAQRLGGDAEGWRLLGRP